MVARDVCEAPWVFGNEGLEMTGLERFSEDPVRFTLGARALLTFAGEGGGSGGSGSDDDDPPTKPIGNPHKPKLGSYDGFGLLDSSIV